MNEPLKYKCIGEMVQRSRCGGGDWVSILDYDDAQVELAALREELARIKGISDNYYSLLVDANQSLAAAEQRNAELISAVRSINRGKHHEVLVPGDDEPQYRQRKEWVDWVLGLCDEASGNKPTESGASES